MDQLLTEVISGLIVNAVSSTATVARNRFSWTPKQQQQIVGQTRSLIIPAIARLSERISPADLDSVTYFLRSAEAEVLVRHYLITVWVDQVVQQEDYLEEQIAALLYLTRNMSQSGAKVSAGVLHNLFLELAKQAVSFVDDRIDTYLRDAVWTPPAIFDLHTLPRAGEFLQQLKPQQVASIVRFENLYLSQVGERHRLITPPSLDSKELVPIDNIYVSPRVTVADLLVQDSAELVQDSAEPAERIQLNRLLNVSHRTVILGNPGAGKSTLIEKLMYDISEDRLRHNYAAPSIPFRVVLRDYFSNKILHNTSLLEHITTRIKIDYMVDIPGRFVEYFLETGRGIVLFDGLDELVHAYQRREVAADVRTFSSRYGSAPIIVTSRAVGYEAAPLPSDEFARYHLEDFDDDQVIEYSQKWFALSRTVAESEKAQLAQTFIIESASVLDLRSNPLMLALLCNIYRGERHIPRNRADVYRRCSTMLFERWDKDRGIIYPLPFLFHLRYAISYLAEWIYSNQQLQSGVGERDLITKTTEYLHGRVFETEEEAEAAATDFVNFCRGRAWVLTDVGEELYQFSHRTFLEYFAALNVSRRISNATEFWDNLRSRLARSEWDMVAQLALVLFDESHEGGADQILGLFLDELPAQARDVASNLIDWALESMAAVVPAPVTRRRVAEATLKRVVESVPLDQDQSIALNQSIAVDWTGLSFLSEVASDNIASMTDAIVSDLQQRVLSDELDDAIRGAVVFLLLSETSKISIEFDWRPYLPDKYITLRPRLRELSSVDLSVGVLAYRNGLVNFDELLNSHGLTSIFTHFMVKSSKAGSSSLYIGELMEEFFSSRMRFTKEMAIAIANKFPQDGRINVYDNQTKDFQAADSAFDSLDTRRRLCVWLAFAVQEMVETGERHVINTDGKSSLASIFRARGKVKEEDALIMSKSVFGQQYGSAICRWIIKQSMFS